MTLRLSRRGWGVGERRVLLLHGSTSSSATWWRIGPALAELGWAVTALDLPSHGASPRLNGALTPHAAAEAVAATVSGERFDLLVGHSFGAVTAMVLATKQPRLADGLVLEEPPGPDSVDWESEARSVRQGAPIARRDSEAVCADTRERQPRWSAKDCNQAVQDLAACAEEDVAVGLERGRTWPALTTEVGLTQPIQLLLARRPSASTISRMRRHFAPPTAPVRWLPQASSEPSMLDIASTATTPARAGQRRILRSRATRHVGRASTGTT